MEKLNRTINSALLLANAHGIENPSQVDQLIGAMTRKLADGLRDWEIYYHGRELAKQLSKNENANRAIDQIIDQIQRTGNPLTAAQAL